MSEQSLSEQADAFMESVTSLFQENVNVAQQAIVTFWLIAPAVRLEYVVEAELLEELERAITDDEPWFSLHLGEIINLRNVARVTWEAELE